MSGKFGVAVGKGLGSVSHIGVTDGNVTAAAVEDLGGGMKAGATIDMRTRGREQNVSTAVKQEIGRDATVFISGGFGTLTAGSVEAGNGIMGLGMGGTVQSLQTGLDGALWSGAAYGNLLQYTSPAISGFNFALVRLDSIAAVAVANTVTATTGAITANNDAGVSANQIGMAYANGPLSASADYAMFANKTTAATDSDRTRIRASASYDFGAVKIGAGFEDNKGSVYNSATFAAVTSPTYAGNQVIVGASAPIGNLRVGLAYGRNTESGVIAAAQANGNEVAKGFVTSADYSFSKRTTLNMSYSDIKRTGGAAYAIGYNGATAAGTTVEHTTNSGSQYRVRLMHAF